MMLAVVKCVVELQGAIHGKSAGNRKKSAGKVKVLGEIPF